VEVLGEEDEKEETRRTETFTGEVEFEGVEVTPQLSMNAMNGSPGYNTMGVNGHIGKKIIHILLDSGSTPNFLDEQLAKKLGYRLELTPTQSVVIAGGRSCHASMYAKGLLGPCMALSLLQMLLFCLWVALIWSLGSNGCQLWALSNGILNNLGWSLPIRAGLWC